MSLFIENPVITFFQNKGWNVKHLEELEISHNRDPLFHTLKTLVDNEEWASLEEEMKNPLLSLTTRESIFSIAIVKAPEPLLSFLFPIFSSLKEKKDLFVSLEKASSKKLEWLSSKFPNIQTLFVQSCDINESAPVFSNLVALKIEQLFSTNKAALLWASKHKEIKELDLSWGVINIQNLEEYFPEESVKKTVYLQGHFNQISKKRSFTTHFPSIHEMARDLTTPSPGSDTSKRARSTPSPNSNTSKRADTTPSPNSDKISRDFTARSPENDRLERITTPLPRDRYAFIETTPQQKGGGRIIG